jgi:hypothetical protein
MEKYEDATLRKVFAVTLDPAQRDANASPPVVYLQQLAQVRRPPAGAPPKAHSLPSACRSQPLCQL